jgi:hypothetical protein
MKAHPTMAAHSVVTPERIPYRLPRKETAHNILSGMFRRSQVRARANN